MCQYLERRSNGAYYFRRPIPRRLQPAFDNRVQWMFSLRTKDRDEAKRLVVVETLRTQRELDEAVTDTAASRPVGAIQTHPDRAAGWVAEQLERSLEAAQMGEAEEAGREAIEEQHAAEADAMAMLFAGPIEAVPSNLRGAALAWKAERFETELSRQNEGIWRGRYRRRKREDGDRDAHRVVGAAPAPDTTGLTLDGIADRVATERKLSAKTSDAQRAVARWFHDRVGRMPVSTINRKHVLAFKDALLEEGQTATNVNVKLSRLATLLQWAADNDHATENAASRIRVDDRGAARNARRPFDLAALNAIFAGPVFTAGERPTRGRGEAAYWLPLLALFTGARLEELAQLRVSDVVTMTYPDADGSMQSGRFLRITEDDADGLKLKNAGSERLVPVHPELERLGFLAYADAQPDGQLFPLLRAGAYGRLGAKWGEWFTTYRRSVGVTDRRLVFHSFRHAFKDYLRAAGVEDGVQRALMGHTGGDVADRYGSGYGLHRLVEGMRHYRVPGLKLPPTVTYNA